METKEEMIERLKKLGIDSEEQVLQEESTFRAFGIKNPAEISVEPKDRI